MWLFFQIRLCGFSVLFFHLPTHKPSVLSLFIFAFVAFSYSFSVLKSSLMESIVDTDTLVSSAYCEIFCSKGFNPTDSQWFWDRSNPGEAWKSWAREGLSPVLRGALSGSFAHSWGKPSDLWSLQHCLQTSLDEFVYECGPGQRCVQNKALRNSWCSHFCGSIDSVGCEMRVPYHAFK